MTYRHQKYDKAAENAAANAEALKTAQEILLGDRVGINVREVRIARALVRFEQMNALYRELLKSNPAHASAPKGCGCADCAIDREPCPTCYAKWWNAVHPNVRHDGDS